MQTEKDIDKLSDDINELVHNSGDSRVSVNIQQITSRFQAIQLASREILKKCEQAYTDHKFFNEKYRQCADWIEAAVAKFHTYQKSVEFGSRDILSKESNILQELLAEEVSANLLLNNVIELGEKLYPNTSTEGKEIVSLQLNNLQQSMETLFDNLNTADRELKSNLTRWSSFDESMKKLTDWLKSIEDSLSDLKLWTTLDEKKEQQEKYKKINNEIVSYKENIAELKEKLAVLPNSKETVESEILELNDKYQVLLKRAQEFVESYESIVNDHVQFDKAVSEAKSWLENTQNVISKCNDSSLDNTNLRTNLDKLKNIKASLRDEESKILSVKSLADRVINQSKETARPHIQSIVERLQAELAKLVSFLDVSMDQLQTKINSWDEYDKFRDHCLEWLRKADAEVHAIDLKSNAAEKRNQLDKLKVLQGEIRAKELEIDQVTEKAQQLTKGANKRNSQISEIEAKYQQVSQRVKDTTAKWQQFVADHEDLDEQIVVLDEWLQDLKTKLSDCENIKNSTRREIERKIGIVQEISLKKDDGFKKIQALVELAQTVLANTASSGHTTINDEVTRLQEDWSAIASRMIETKNILDNAISKWTSIIQDIQDLSKAIEWMKAQIAEHSVLTGTMSEKKSQLDSIKQIEEKVRCDKIEVDNLRQTASNIFDSRQGEDISNCQHILDEYDECVQKIQKLLKDRECQFRDHKVYKEAYDELQRWMTRAQEKVPQLKQRPLSDKLSIDNFSGPLDHLLNKKAQGEILIEQLEHTAQVILPNTSESGQEIINNDIRALKEAFERLFKDVKEQREQLEVVLEHWREYKDEYERISDWLQQLTILIKNQKIALCPNLEEKEKQVKIVKDLLKQIQDGKEQIDALNDSAKILLKSPLETYVNNQLQQLNSRYEVEVNLAADVLKKIENNYKQHKEYSENLEKSRNWIDNAKDLIKNCSETSSLTSKDVLQSHLNKLQNLFQERENGQSLIHATVNCGEKVLRNTRSDGKEVINAELKEIQNDWERVVKKMSSAKVHLETALLQWADYDSSYNQLQQWITDREAKLQKVTEVKLTKTGKSGLDALPIGERRATLRETGSIMQDIVSFEPMIQSVTSKAEDLKQAAPASEISSKYEILSKQAQAIYAKQKETIDSHQSFIDAGNDFVQWIRSARERLGKCSIPLATKKV
ncbi:hypothetical protein WA026_011945 [Henosepilachna vigintioctopunctata]|uniref:Nesprin-1 n=1 Tax=Henosepilachna vigintioctopunctata TaxID=420089 RepID=A0AAW1V7D3_9CUCU